MRRSRRAGSDAAHALLKFHGTYEQFDHDTATPRKQAGLEKEWQFMVRVRAPGGIITAAQYLALDEIAGCHANGTLKIMTRQGSRRSREAITPTPKDVCSPHGAES